MDGSQGGLTIYQIDSPLLGSNLNPGAAKSPNDDLAEYRGREADTELIQVIWAIASEIVFSALQGLQGAVGCAEPGH